MSKSLGIDIGGTKTSMGIVNTLTGNISKKIEFPSKLFKNDKANLTNIINNAKTILKDSGIDCVGIGVPELIDNKGIIKGTYNFKWNNLDFKNMFSKKIKVKADSDVRNHLRAEKYFGYGRGKENFAYINIGSGISYSLMIDNKIYTGARGYAIHFGSSKISLFNPKTNKTNSLIPEEFYSGKPIIKKISKMNSSYEKNYYLDKISNSLASFIGNLINTIDPELVILGGGVILNNSNFTKKLILDTRKYIFCNDVKKINIKITKIKEDTGLLGAGLLFN